MNKYSLILLSLFLIGCNQSILANNLPRFVEKSFLNKGISDVFAKFPRLRKVKCSSSNPNHEKECSNKYGKPCACYNNKRMVINARERLTIKTIGDTVNYQSYSWASTQRDLTMGLPLIENIVQNVAPTYAAKNKFKAGPLNTYNVTWVFEKGRASILAICPQVNLEGKWVEVRSLRSCFASRLFFENTSDPLEPKYMKTDKTF
jgi:hypothetical protein